MDPSSLNKGLGDPNQKPWNVLSGDVSLPAACLILPHIESNIKWMSQFCHLSGTLLCPHVKTSMTPRLMKMQIDQGCWGVTTATVQQTLVAYHFGIQRVLMANQLIDRRNMELIANLQSKDSEFNFYCLIDSLENMKTLFTFFKSRNQMLKVLIEIGTEGGRTGVRNENDLLTLLTALKSLTPTLTPMGVEFYEGVTVPNDEVSIRHFCRRACQAALHVSAFFDKVTPFILSGAGSAWFDIVTQELTQFKMMTWHGPPLDIILRPGCYVVHDVGIYQESQTRMKLSNLQFLEKSIVNLGDLRPALKLVATVISRPESGLAILGIGKRDVAYDSGFPYPTLIYRTRPNETEKRSICPISWNVFKLMDQHAYLRIDPTDDIIPGDIIVLDISHPCNTFSLWRQLLFVDESYEVLDVVDTYF